MNSQPTTPATETSTQQQDTPALQRAYNTANRIEDHACDLRTLLDDHLLATTVTQRCPSAATVRVEPYDDGNGPDAYLTVRDAAGEILDECIASLRPARLTLEAVYPEDGYDLDLAVALAADPAAAAEQAEETLVHALLAHNPGWPSLVLSPGVVRDQILWETPRDQTDGLTEDEQDEVIRRFRAESIPTVTRALDAAADEFHYQVRRHVEDVLAARTS